MIYLCKAIYFYLKILKKKLAKYAIAQNARNFIRKTRLINAKKSALVVQLYMKRIN